MSTFESDHPGPLISLPEQGKPQQLFMLLHGESANPEQLLPLVQAVRLAFPDALIVLPYGGMRGEPGIYHWLEADGLNESNFAGRVAQALPALVGLVQRVQVQYGLSGEQTALGGFSHGATVALEASMLQPGLAGRVLVFSGRYAKLPVAAPLATTLHFLHGKDDIPMPVSHAQQAHARLAELHGDATLDIASNVGHELHAALIAQAIHRLQTCVPLRSWESALGELNQQGSGGDSGDAPSNPGTGSRTLH